MNTKEGTKKTIADLLKIAFFWAKLYFSITLFLAAIPVIFYFCYLLGHRILEGGMLGGDTAYHLGWIHTLDRFYPRIPMWFPFGGAGSSIVLGYWVFSYYLAIIGSHISSLTVEQWVRLLEFLSVPIVCLEIYLYLWIRLKNQVMATLGALLYPLSSVAWGWVAHAGFYAMQLSTVLILPTFLFFDLYLESELLGGDKVVRKRLYLLGFSLFMALGFLTHSSLMPCLFLGLPFYALLRSQLSPRGSEKRALSLLRATKALVIAIAFGVLAGAFILLPQQQYFSLQPFTPTYGAADTPTLPWRGFLGFERLPASVGSLYTPLFLSILTTVFGLVGIFFATVKRNFLAALGLVALFYVWWLSSARFLALNFPFLSLFLLPTSTRLASITSIYLTIMAAYGLWSIADIPGVVIRFVGRLLGKIGTIGRITEFGLGKLSLLLSSVLVVGLSVWAFYNFRSLQIYPTEETEEWGAIEAYPGYGGLYASLNPPAPFYPALFCKIPGWEDEVGREGGKTCQDYEPKFVIDKANADMWPEGLEDAVKDLDLGKLTRVSISPFLGGVVFSFADHTEASMVEMVSGQALINLGWVSIHDQALFHEGEETAEEVSEIAKWFGTRYVVLHGELNKEEFYRYPEDTWPHVATAGDAVVKEFKKSPGMVTLSTKPTVLVIGSEEKKAYELIFRLAVKGGLSFDQALLIQGTPNIDDYSLEELKKFSTIVLRGYSYRNRQNAWGLLKEFVESGGTLFIDTGWQYVDKDWGKASGATGDFLEVTLSEPSPVKKTLWGSIGKDWDNAILSTGLEDGLDLAKFGLPIWEDSAWGMALADKEDLQPWAESVLTSGDKVIIARGTYGAGKVVWSGMNLFAHAYDKESEEEYRLIGNVFNFLLGQPERIEEGKVSIEWDFPDRIELTLIKVPEKPSFLYWAETFAPYWSADLLRDGKKEPLKIYRAGPGFKAVRLVGLSGGEKLVLEYSLKKIFLISSGITLLALLVLLVLILDALVLNRSVEKKITSWLFGKYPFTWEELGQCLRKKVSGTIHWEAGEE